MIQHIALLTDFGTADTYVAEMKGAIWSIAPDVDIVDVTHAIPPRDVIAGALALARVVPVFPEGTIFLAVVDPGVGTGRRAVIVRTPKSFLVGPDNGLLTLAARREGTAETVEIANAALMRPVVSRTFHGRDVFAPAAAHLTREVPLSEFGPPAGDLVGLDLPEPIVEGDRLVGAILTVDGFGNAITNIDEGLLAAFAGQLAVVVECGNANAPLIGTYGDAKPGKTVALVGSGGTLEIAVVGGSAARAHGLTRGDRVTVTHDSRVRGPVPRPSEA